VPPIVDKHLQITGFEENGNKKKFIKEFSVAERQPKHSVL